MDSFVTDDGGINLNDYFHNVESHSIGAYGFVKKGINKTTKQKTSIKIIIKRKVKPEVQEKKLAILKKLQEINHPGLVKIYNIMEDAKRVYIFSEFIEGTELQKRVISKGPFNERDAVIIIMKQIDTLMQYIKNGLIYLDLRCEKIVQREDKGNYIVKLVDNGTSILYTGQNINVTDLEYKFTDHLFCPPEFNTRKIFNEKSLVWTCGMILYFQISGTFPFSGPEDKNINEIGISYDAKVWNSVLPLTRNVIDTMFCSESIMRPKIVNVRDSIQKFIIPEIDKMAMKESEVNQVCRKASRVIYKPSS